MAKVAQWHVSFKKQEGVRQLRKVESCCKDQLRQFEKKCTVLCNIQLPACVTVHSKSSMLGTMLSTHALNCAESPRRSFNITVRLREKDVGTLQGIFPGRRCCLHSEISGNEFCLLCAVLTMRGCLMREKVLPKNRIASLRCFIMGVREVEEFLGLCDKARCTEQGVCTVRFVYSTEQLSWVSCRPVRTFRST